MCGSYSELDFTVFYFPTFVVHLWVSTDNHFIISDVESKRSGYFNLSGSISIVVVVIFTSEAKVFMTSNLQFIECFWMMMMILFLS